MVTILAGNECTGKSTCFNKLRENFETGDVVDVTFVKEQYTNSLDEKWRRVQYISELTNATHEALFDRATALDDLIYSIIIDKRTSPLVGEFVCSVLSKCRIVYFECDKKILEDRIVQRGDEFVGSDQLIEIASEYEKVFDSYGLSPIRINVSTLTEEQVYEKVLEVLGWEK